MKEYQEFQEKCRNELKKRIKFSKDLLELRHKEDKLIKLQKYEEAESIKERADRLEEKERMVLERKIKKDMAKKEKLLKEQQEKALTALLKRIQRDKNEQLRQRQEDSVKAIAFSHSYFQHLYSFTFLLTLNVGHL